VSTTKHPRRREGRERYNGILVSVVSVVNLVVAAIIACNKGPINQLTTKSEKKRTYSEKVCIIRRNNNNKSTFRLGREEDG